MLQRLTGQGTSTGLAAENRRLRAEVARLRAENAELRAQVEELTARCESQETRLAEQQARIDDLEAKLAINSRNSSKPPSSDPPQTPPRTRRGSRRKRGGQPGHEGTTRMALTPDEADEQEDCVPETCAHCGAALEGEDPEPLGRGVIDIPAPRLEIRWYWLHRLRCPQCGQHTRAEAPGAVGESPFGVHLHALSAVLVGRFRLSKRLVAELVDLLFGLSISPGTVSAIEKRVSAALAAPVEAARVAMQQEAVVHKDETGWRLLKQKAWLWVAVTDKLTIFTIARRRSSAVVKQILGEAFTGIAVTDRWSAYSHLPRRQLCWAHLLRDFTGMIERWGALWHGQRLAVCAREVMATYAAWQTSEITRDEMVAHLEGVRERTRERLQWAAQRAPGPVARAKAREILKLEPFRWTFLEDERVPVTNNLAERLLRYAVIWRKLSYGCDSEAGARFVERVLTVCASLQLQERDVFDFLCQAIDAHSRGQPAPSILPGTSAT